MSFDIPTARDLSGYGFGLAPIHLLVPHESLRRERDDFIFHICSRTLPENSLIKIDKETYVTSYPLTFALLARNPKISVLALSLLAYEFCGKYAYVESGRDGYTEILQPQTTVEEISQLLDRFSWCKGVTKARAALKITRNNSRSPMESFLALRVLLPQRLGGLNISNINLNEELPLNAVAKNMTGLDEFHGDITVAGRKVDIEYYSREHHTEHIKADYDAFRSDVLRYLDYDVLTMTPTQFYSDKHFDSFARRLYKAVGKTYHIPSISQQAARNLLLNELTAAERMVKQLTPELHSMK